MEKGIIFLLFLFLITAFSLVEIKESYSLVPRPNEPAPEIIINEENDVQWQNNWFVDNRLEVKQYRGWEYGSGRQFECGDEREKSFEVTITIEKSKEQFEQWEEDIGIELGISIVGFNAELSKISALTIKDNVARTAHYPVSIPQTHEDEAIHVGGFWEYERYTTAIYERVLGGPEKLLKINEIKYYTGAFDTEERKIACPVSTEREFTILEDEKIDNDAFEQKETADLYKIKKFVVPGYIQQDSTNKDFRWDLDNGKIMYGFEALANYTDIATYNVTLTFTNENNKTQTAKFPTEVVANKPIATINGPRITSVNSTETFDGIDSKSTNKGAIVEWDWDFCGNKRQGKVINYVFTIDEHPECLVTLTVVDNKEAWENTTRVVIVKELI